MGCCRKTFEQLQQLQSCNWNEKHKNQNAATTASFQSNGVNCCLVHLCPKLRAIEMSWGMHSRYLGSWRVWRASRSWTWGSWSSRGKVFCKIRRVRAMRPVYMELLGPKPAEVRITVSQGNTDVMVRWCGLMLNPSASKPCTSSKRMGEV